VSSAPLSETHIAGRPREAIRASSSRTTRSPGNEVSGTSARHFRVKSSTIARMRNRRPSAKAVRQELSQDNDEAHRFRRTAHRDSCENTRRREPWVRPAPLAPSKIRIVIQRIHVANVRIGFPVPARSTPSSLRSRAASPSTADLSCCLASALAQCGGPRGTNSNYPRGNTFARLCLAIKAGRPGVSGQEIG
jgi:hypothetical protein